MTDYRKEFNLVDADSTYYASNVTGDSWTITQNASPNSLAYKIALKNDSATDHSLKTVIFTGLDADGKAQTETISMPGASATVETTKYFSYLTSAVPSATIGADTMDIGTSDEIVSITIPLETTKTASLGLDLVSGILNYTLELTYNNVLTENGPYNWQEATSSGQPFNSSSSSQNTFFLSPPRGS